MPRLIRFCPLAVGLLCSLAALCLPSLAGATESGVPARLRVLIPGKVLAEETLRTGTTSIPTSSKATCFGKGTGGDGKAVSIEGPTALGLLAQAGSSNPALRPLLVSDHFSFGLALCGVGRALASGKASWYLTVNHKSPRLGGSKVMLRAGDEVLWYLAPSYPYPEELALSAPPSASAGKPFGVRVFTYSEKGKRRPAAGASVTGASTPTDASGRATVRLSRPTALVATLGAEIPSGREAVCIGGKCPSGSIR